MIKRSFLLVTAALTMLVASAMPAMAQTGGSTSISGISNGGAYTGSVTVRGSASAAAASNVRHLEIQINGSVVRAADYSGIKESATIEYGWNTNSVRNGEVAVTVRATFSSGSPSSTSYKVKVDNAPSTPSGVASSWNGSNVAISWNSNPEPDITGYRVERDSGGGWSSIGQVGGTSASDSPGPGSHSYRVIALRYSPTQGEKASSPSGGVSVSVPQPSTGDSGSGDGSGSGSTGGGYYGGGSGSGGKDGSGSGGGGGYYGGYYGEGKNSGSKSGSGSNLPGYGSTGGKGKKGPSGAGGNPWGAWGLTGARNFGGIGLPGRLTLPGSNTPLSPSAQDGIDWGSYEEALPYDLQGGTGAALPDEFLGGPGTTAASYEYTLIPPDGLRWVAAGLWFLVAAGLLKFLERRLAVAEAGAATGAIDIPTGMRAKAKAAAKKMSLRELLADDPIPAAVTDDTAEATAATTDTSETTAVDTEQAAVVETTKDGDAMSFKTSGSKRKLKVVKDDAA